MRLLFDQRSNRASSATAPVHGIRVMLEEAATRSAVPRMRESTLAELVSLVEQMEEQAAAIRRDHVAQVGRALVGYVRQRDESGAVTTTVPEPSAWLGQRTNERHWLAQIRWRVVSSYWIFKVWADCGLP